ncbi:MAG: UDP-glucose 4-epimerase GalE [Myxococcota bacterium]|nr:UDP-glucose 4-epimerase GalE [Myxococcota bacterium]
MHILVTGGAGYVGSHTVVELLDEGHDVTVVDSLVNSDQRAIEQVEALTGRPIPLVVGDIREDGLLDGLFAQHRFDAVFHFAGLKAVGESTKKPMLYYDNNVGGAMTLLRAMARHQIFTFVFSSSATVYGDPDTVPITEDSPLRATNPYGWTKLMIEQMLFDLAKGDPRWRMVILRYFNPVGAHPSGQIGEDPQGIPNNLVPFIAQVAVGRRDELLIFGGDYATADGTGVRDYIHVVDLAKGHTAALRAHHDQPGAHVYNLGTGQGVSVLAMREAFERASQRPIPYRIVERRAGDIATCFADPSRAEAALGWTANLSLDAMVQDTWRWQSMFPHGFRSDP